MVVLRILVAALVAACYSPGYQACRIACGDAGACPEGTTCGDDGFCHGAAAEVCTARFTVITAGGRHGCGIDGGALFCWGDNSSGQLGTGDGSAASAEPVPVGEARDWFAVSAGEAHTCGIRGDPAAGGQLYCWGLGDYGRLGIGTESRPVPTPVGFEEAVAVSAGGQHTCALTAGRVMWCWGFNDGGQLGNGTSGPGTEQTSPSLVADGFVTWQSVEAGAWHTCGILADGGLRCWGWNADGQVGDDSTDARATPVEIAGGTLFSQVSAGDGHTCAIGGGALYCWGSNGDGRLGDGSGGQKLTPARVGTADDWSEISAGGAHSCGRRGGELLCWGAAPDGRVGDGAALARSVPTPVAGAGSWAAVAAGAEHTCAVRADASAWCWGSNDDGQLGVGTIGRKAAPALIHPGPWRRVAAGLSSTCAIRDDETLHCFGANGDGQVGDGQWAPTDRPAAVSGGGAWEWVSVGDGHACGIRDGGELWCWGDNAYGQLGDGRSGDGADSAEPVRVGSDSDWDGVSVGAWHSCAVRAGLLFCWGLDLGATPVWQPPGPWTTVDVGVGRACAVSQAPSLWCWELVPGAAPAWVADPGWYGVEVGAAHQCGVSGGDAWCWGEDGYGQLGDGMSGEPTPAPALVAGADREWSFTTAGHWHSCGVAQGELWCWGRNDGGQVGDGTREDRAAPVPIAAGNAFTSVSAGGAHTCAVDGQGALWCWGQNGGGQLGDGTGGRATPTPVRMGTR